MFGDPDVSIWWFQIFLYGHPEPWGDDHLTRIFFRWVGEKPPTRKSLVILIPDAQCIYLPT